MSNQTMGKKEISMGVVHDLPKDLEDCLLGDEKTLELWEGLTALGRNEWICWVEDAKKPETRRRRIERVIGDIGEGKRRPCCWPG